MFSGSCARGGCGDSRRSIRSVRRSTSDSISSVSSRASSPSTRRASSCAAPLRPASGFRSSCASPFSAADSAEGSTVAGSSPGNSSTGCASSHQPPPSRRVSRTSAYCWASLPGKPNCRRRRRTRSLSGGASITCASRCPSISNAAIGRPGRRRALTPSQRENARLPPSRRPAASHQTIGVASASRGADKGSIAPI